MRVENYKELEQIYYKQMKEGKTEQERKEARDQLIILNIPLARKIVKGFLVPDTAQSYTKEDFEQCAYIGLIKCIDVYNPQKGALGTILPFYIKAAIVDAMYNHDSLVRVPQNPKRQYWDYKTEKELYGISMDEYCKKHGLDYKKMIEIAKCCSLPLYIDSETRNEEDNTSLRERLTDLAYDIDDSLWKKDFYEMLNACKTHLLTEKEYDVLMRRYGLKDGICETLDEVGKHYGITRERVRQLEQRAIQKIKRRYNNEASTLRESCPMFGEHRYVVITG